MMPESPQVAAKSRVQIVLATRRVAYVSSKLEVRNANQTQ